MIGRIALVLIAIALLLALMGRLTGPRVGGKPARRVESARKCAVCDAYVLDSRPGPCARPDCPGA